jgi:hypothetical protein
VVDAGKQPAGFVDQGELIVRAGSAVEVDLLAKVADREINGQTIVAPAQIGDDLTANRGGIDLDGMRVDHRGMGGNVAGIAAPQADFVRRVRDDELVVDGLNCQVVVMTPGHHVRNQQIAAGIERELRRGAQQHAAFERLHAQACGKPLRERTRARASLLSMRSQVFFQPSGNTHISIPNSI